MNPLVGSAALSESDSSHNVNLKLPASFPSLYRQPAPGTGCRSLCPATVLSTERIVSLLDLVRLADTPNTPHVLWSPDRKSVLLLDFHVNVPIEDISRAELRLAGIRIKAESLAPTLESYYRRMVIMSVADGVSRAVTGLPYPDGEYLMRCVSWVRDDGA